MATTLTIKNMPTSLHQRLKESAHEHRRSINQEVMNCLEQILVKRELDPEQILREARAVRARLPHLYLTEEEISAAKREGRP